MVGDVSTNLRDFARAGRPCVKLVAVGAQPNCRVVGLGLNYATCCVPGI
jgi:hypothetical protein